MRVLVCGGRNYKDRNYLFEMLDKVNAEMGITTIIHGCASGADTLAGAWAINNGILEERYPARWDLYGKRAGSLRNHQMLASTPDLVVAFPGGVGTEHMVTISRSKGIKCLTF